MAAARYRAGLSSRSGATVKASQTVAPNAAVVGWLLIALSSLLVIVFQPLWELAAPFWFMGDLATASSANIDARRMWGIVEYHPAFPAVSRLRGHRMTPGGRWGLVMLAPGLVGAMLTRSARSGSSTRHWQLDRSQPG